MFDAHFALIRFQRARHIYLPNNLIILCHFVVGHRIRNALLLPLAAAVGEAELRAAGRESYHSRTGKRRDYRFCVESAPFNRSNSARECYLVPRNRDSDSAATFALTSTPLITQRWRLDRVLKAFGVYK